MSLIIGSNKYKPYVGNKGASVFLGDKKLYPIGPNYLTFTAAEVNSSVTLKKNGSLNSVIEYNDGSGWKNYTFGTAINLTNVGDKVQFRGDNASLSYSSSNYMQFVMTGEIAASGSVMTLFDNKDELRTVKIYMCYRLFSNCASLVKAPELPATTLVNYCYQRMFYNCTSLVKAPELPATTLIGYCYSYMFYNCASLINAPELPATTLADHCYDYMFSNCTSLINVPELSSTTLAGYCYYHMFDNCTSLVKALELPATTLPSRCYSGMFKSTKIKLSTTKTGEYQTAYRIPSVGTGIDGTGSLTDMFSDTRGTFTGTPNINTTYYGAW